MSFEDEVAQAAQRALYAAYQAVESSAISRVNWEADFLDTSGKSGTMNVEFTNGHGYAYPGVPVDVFEEFLASSSKGRFLNQVIKPQYG